MAWFSVLRRDLSPSLTSGFAERLHGTYSITLMFVLAGVMLWETGYYSGGIACFCPGQFAGTHVDYTKKTCWSENIHWLPQNSTTTLKDHTHRTPVFNVGKYSAFIAIGLAVLLLFPRVLSRYTTGKLGSSVKSILELPNGSSGNNRATEAARGIAEYLQESPKGVYFMLMCIFVRSIYLVISMIQLALINTFLGISITDVISRLVTSIETNTDMISSARFPEVVLCDLAIRRLGNMQYYTIQCSLPVNRVLEKMWILFLFWIIAVTIVGVFSLVKFIVIALVQKYHVRFIGHRLAIKGKIQNAADAQAWFFVYSYLGRDGFLILKLISENVGEDVTADVIDRLWSIWRDEANKDDSQSEPLTLNPIS